MTKPIALICSLAIFAAICSVLAYFQRKGKVAENVIPFTNEEECLYL